MTLNLFGIRHSRSPDVDWYHNPHEALERCAAIKTRKLIWLCYDSTSKHPYYNSHAWQTIFNVTEFKRRILPGFAPADSPVWNTTTTEEK